VLYAVGTALAVMILAALSGYAFSRYRFRGHDALMIAILAITGVPLLTNLLALYQMGISLRKLPIPIYNDRVFIIIVYAGFFLPMSVWIAKGFFDAIPRELEEAGLIDGCSPVGGLVRIVLPLVTPGLTAIFLLTFVGVWNEFIAGYLLITKNSLKPAMFGMYDFLGQNLINAQLIAAACIIIALPMVIVFLIARRSFFRAMVEGAIKG
jgi:ABC-type maltose transport system permease subunit